jgi:hypothetical protein
MRKVKGKNFQPDFIWGIFKELLLLYRYILDTEQILAIVSKHG